MGYRCWDCDKWFPSGGAARAQHANVTGCRATDPSKPYECRKCYDVFAGKQDRREHEAWEHSYCVKCDRYFMNGNNAWQHLHSQKHMAAAISCPLCKAGFTTATGVVHHIERGACPRATGMSRDNLYRFLRSRDPQGLICNRLIGWKGSVEYEATDRSWNGSGYECYICHRVFGQLRALNQHLSSPAHQQSLYHCPNRSCRQQFKTLAAFVNHVESESCGLMRFDAVQKRVTDMMKGGRLIGY